MSHNNGFSPDSEMESMLHTTLRMTDPMKARFMREYYEASGCKSWADCAYMAMRIAKASEDTINVDSLKRYCDGIQDGIRRMGPDVRSVADEVIDNMDGRIDRMMMRVVGQDMTLSESIAILKGELKSEMESRIQAMDLFRPMRGPFEDIREDCIRLSEGGIIPERWNP